MKEGTMQKRMQLVDKLYMLQRGAVFLAFVCIFFSALNPAKISNKMARTLSLFTCAVSYNSIYDIVKRAIHYNMLTQETIRFLYAGAMLILVGIILCCISMCMSLGNLKLRRIGLFFGFVGVASMIIGLVLVYISYNQLASSAAVKELEPVFPKAFILYVIISLIILVTSIIILLILPKAGKEDRPYMEAKYKLFLMFLPFALLCFAFSYLPLWGWRYAFFNYSSGDTLSLDNFVGFHWFTLLLADKAYRIDILRVLRNTLAMSGLGLLTSWLPIAFAIFLNEIKNSRFRRIIQTCTTIPNFISWVLVYSIALAIFSTDGFINTMTGGSENYMMDASHMWIKMLLWGTWKGIGWSAIIYIAGISGIDQQLYEAADIDGAGRFQKMWHITVPGLLPTYFVMLLMQIANILSNGMDQYLVFSNARNIESLEVLDLYVYNLGIGSGGLIPLSTAIGMLKSVISVILLFAANRFSKAVRGESIV
mgnify:CR=1 FL=1